MKNLRIAKKNPSKVLKILEGPNTCRYIPSKLQQQISAREQKIITTQKQQSKHLNTLSYRQKSVQNSPTNSNRYIEYLKSNQSKKIRNRSLGNSQEGIKMSQHRYITISFKNSLQLRSKKDQNPYYKRSKLRQSQKLLNFNSVILENRLRRQQRNKNIKISPYGKRNYRFTSSQEKVTMIPQLKFNEEALKSAKKLLDQKEYRKSLLLIKPILINIPHHNEALFLTGINWYYLQDFAKSIYYIEQVINNNPLFSSQCYTIIAVSHYKLLELGKSLKYLKLCHRNFPEESQSYGLQGQILCKMQRFHQALKCYERGYQISKTSQFLFNKAQCYQLLKQQNQALNCYIQYYIENGFSIKVCHSQIKIHHKLKEYDQIIKLYELYQPFLNINKDNCYEKQEIFELIAYSYYKLSILYDIVEQYQKCMIIADQGITISQNPWKLHRLQLMININKRDIYEASHIINKIKPEPNLRVYCTFVEGVISLMRRNFNDGITTLLLIQDQLGFNFETQNRFSKKQQQFNLSQLKDQFLNEIKRIYLMFLSYGYFNIAQFFSCKNFLLMQISLGIPQQFQRGVTYNLYMCEGIICHCDKLFKEAQRQFSNAFLLYQNKLEPPFSLALNYIQLMVNAQNQQEKLIMIERAKQYFAVCHKIVGGISGNIAASVFYFSSLVYAYTQEWKEAVNFIDQSIEKSQDHYWRYYYVRALYLACIHSFKQAINDLIVAISLAGQTRPQCYLLRSKCLQIEGQGNQAFKDLQQYLSLKPDDQNVHKYAGQLLFENGAFQDALTAFSHQQIEISLENYDIFLTQGKSYFLLGRFDQAYNSIKICQKLKQNKQLQFDLKIVKILHQMINKLDKPEHLSSKIQQVYKQYDQMGTIFKKSDYYIFKAVCFMLQENYLEASVYFLKTFLQKSKQLHEKEHEDDISVTQNKKELQSFSNQMKFNIVICKLLLGNLQEAIKLYNDIKVQFDQNFYGDFVIFRKFLLGEIQNYKKQEVFPNKNKFSNFLDKFKLKVKNRNNEIEAVIYLKLSIPFPKVEPPQIFPAFDQNLLTKLSVLNVERKPQAPWIIHENNSIKFTDKIETFSKFELQDSQSQSASTYQMISIETSQLDKKSHCSKRIHASFIEKGSSKSQMSKYVE